MIVQLESGNWEAVLSLAQSMHVCKSFVIKILHKIVDIGDI